VLEEEKDDDDAAKGSFTVFSFGTDNAAVDFGPYGDAESKAFYEELPGTYEGLRGAVVWGPPCVCGRCVFAAPSRLTPPPSRISPCTDHHHPSHTPLFPLSDADLLSTVPLMALGLTPEQAAALREEWKAAKEKLGQEGYVPPRPLPLALFMRLTCVWCVWCACVCGGGREGDAAAGAEDSADDPAGAGAGAGEGDADDDKAADAAGESAKDGEGAEGEEKEGEEKEGTPQARVLLLLQVRESNQNRPLLADALAPVSHLLLPARTYTYTHAHSQHSTNPLVTRTHNTHNTHAGEAAGVCEPRQVRRVLLVVLPFEQQRGAEALGAGATDTLFSDLCLGVSIALPHRAISPSTFSCLPSPAPSVPSLSPQ